MADSRSLEKLDNAGLAGLAVDFLRRSALHYGMWFNEINYQLGLEEAIQAESEVFARFYPLLMKRLAEALGFKQENGLPLALTALPREKLLGLLDAEAASWLAGDGLWFQAVEKRREMFTARRCNDTCWSKFSPFEARRIKDLLCLPEGGGLDALESALGCRLYSRINTQSIERESNSLIFRMVNCRVQDARRRKGLEDYPCKSAGVVEYSSCQRYRPAHQNLLHSLPSR
jgi:hypothetical protein